jgi:amino acid adenylation domain-containing protein
VLQVARRQPERIAVISEDRSITYGQLLEQTAALAHELRQAGAARNVPIAVVTQAGCERVIAPLGILEAGAPYVPIDPDLPAERMQVMMEDAGVRIAVTTADLDASLSWPEGVRRVLVNRLKAAPAAAVGVQPLQSPSDTAYIIYTSGSSGRPKGVAIDHRGPLNTIVDINERYAIGLDDRLIALSNLSFDLSVYDIFGLLGAGGTLVYPPVSRLRDATAWAAAVERHNVTLWNTVPLLYSEVVEAARETGASLASLRLVLMSGDWIPLDLPLRSRALNPTTQLVGLGGATEASIWSIYYAIGDIDPAWRSIPYGKPLRNQRFHVLDTQLNACPDWVEGDLYIGGIGLAQGYWRDEERTKASFFTHPRTGERLYRTGDRGRYFPDGNIEFLGRQDSQVKIRGFRVELGDVESNLRRHTDVRDCFVLLRPLREDTSPSTRAESERQFLVAYVVAAPDTAPTQEPLLAFLKERLPGHMVPSRIVVVDRIPKSPNGKVDRRALPDPIAGSLDGQTTKVAPSTDTECAIAGIWSEVLDLQVAELSVHDAFLDLGGNSLLLTRLHRKLTAAFPHRQHLQVVQLFEHQTIARLGRLMDGEVSKAKLDVDRLKRRVARKRQMTRAFGTASGRLSR